MLFLEKLEQKRFYLIAVIILCMLIGGIYGLKYADKESLSSTSVMLIKKESGQDSAVFNNGALELSNNLVSTYEELIKSDSNLDSIKVDLNIDMHNGILKDKISVSKVSNSDTFKIQVVGTFKNGKSTFINAPKIPVSTSTYSRHLSTK